MTLDSRFYITGGTLPANATSYIDRDADSLLFRRLQLGEFCYILTSRQMGKSSLMTRMVKRLRDHGVAAAVVDPSGMGFDLDARQWYNGLLYQIAASLNIEAETEAFRRCHGHLSPLQLWQQTLREVVLNAVSANITIFIDEIDVVRNLPFSADEFFAAIRACYNMRAEDCAYDRLNFCLLGVSTPTDLISNVALTPFNIGTRVELRDFTRVEISHLGDGLGRSIRANSAMIDRIYYWTSGHPYLTQRLCLAAAENGARSARRCVDSCVRDVFLSASPQRQDGNIQFVNQRMLATGDDATAGLLTLFARIQSGAAVEDSDSTAHVAALKLAGIVGSANGKLKVRNRIYRRVFNEDWIEDKMPGAERRRQQSAYRRGLVRATAAASAIIGAMGVLTVWAMRAQHQANLFRVQSDTANSASQLRLQDVRRASYALTMNLIQSEWDLHNIDHVLDMLSATRNSEYRGFEWGYWNRLCHLDAATLKGHNGSVNAVSFSPDGKRVATGCRDGAVRIWEAYTGREILSFAAALRDVKHPRIGVTSLAFSPNGERIAVGCDTTLGIYSSITGKCLWNPGPDAGAAMCVAFSADGNRLAAGTSVLTGRKIDSQRLGPYEPEQNEMLRQYFRCQVKVWDTSTGRELLTLSGHSDGIKSVAFSRDGTRIASGSYDKTARIWNLATARQILEIKEPTHVITSVAFSPDGKRLLTGLKREFEPENQTANSDQAKDRADSTVKIWDAFSGREKVRLRGYTSTVKAAVFSPDGKQIATAGYDKTARLWDSMTGKQQLVLNGHTDYVVAVAFSPDGERLVSGSSDRTAKVWDCTAFHEELILPGEAGRVTSVAVSRNGKFLLTGSGSTAATWDPTTGRENVSYPDITSNSNRPRTGGEAEVRYARTGNVLLKLIGHKGDVTSLAFSPNGDRIVTGSYDGTAKVWNTITGCEILTLIGHACVVTSTAFSQDGCYIVTGSADKTAKIWDAATGREIRTLLGHTAAVSSVAVSPDGIYIVTGGADRTARLWEAASGREVRSLRGHSDEVLAVALSPDGRSVVTGSADNTAVVWNSATGVKRCTLKGHSDNVNSAAYSPDGRRIVTGSDDHTSIIWDAETGQKLLTLRGHTRAVHGVCFSPSGGDVVTGSWDKTTRVWQAVFE